MELMILITFNSKDFQQDLIIKDHSIPAHISDLKDKVLQRS